MKFRYEKDGVIAETNSDCKRIILTIPESALIISIDYDDVNHEAVQSEVKTLVHLLAGDI